ncbi:MAG: insulinase family protein [Flavobacteriales bacterium]|nr:insulinase family protein [Flavobacteriales bacterium]
MKNIITTILLTASVSLLHAQIDRTTAPKPGIAPKINIGTPASFTLDNGLKVFVVENHKLPKVSFQLTIDKDPVLENGTVGLADMMGDMLSAGTTTKTKAQIDEEIDFVGASVSTFSSGFYASSLTKHSDKVLGIAADILLNPAFPQDELDKKKKRAFSSLKSLATNADAIAGRVTSVLKYGKSHPYGEVQMKSDIENITIDACKKYYETYFRPNISYLVIVGDITVEDAKKLTEKYLGSWQKADVPEHKYDMPSATKGVRVAFVNKPGAVQSVIKVIYPIDYKIGAPDAAAVSVMSNIFGGAFSSYLNANLREDKAYTYGARGGVRADNRVGSFNAGASVRNEVTDSSVTQFLFEMNHIINEKPSQADLDRIKNNMNGGFALSLENDQTIARFALNIERYGLPKDYYQTYLSRLQNVQFADVGAAARKYIHPENCIILVVGNKDIAGTLTKFDSDGVIEFYDINGDVKVDKPAKELPLGLTAEKVLEDYFFAITGESTMKSVEKKYKKIKDITIVMETEMQGMKLQITTKQMAPNKSFFELNMQGMTVQKQVFDGKNGGSSGMQGKKALEGEELEAMKEQAIMNKELKYKELGYTLKLESIEEVNGKDAYKVTITNSEGEVKYDYFDVESSLKVYTTSTEKGPDGTEMESYSEYSDYKDVNGIKYPFTRTRNMGPQVVELTVTDIKVNAKVKASEFTWE